MNKKKMAGIIVASIVVVGVVVGIVAMSEREADRVRFADRNLELAVREVITVDRPQPILASDLEALVELRVVPPLLTI